MKYIKGQNRTQAYLFPVSLDDAISEDNEVRLIDVFVDKTFLNICTEYKDSTDFSVKRIYQCVWPYSQAEKIMKNIPTYHKGKEIYLCEGMPAPDVEIEISLFGSTKKKVLAAHASQHNNIKRYIKYYHYYPAWLYFS